jgi:glycosyltransferase involved in cell wall biosynthesis
MMMKSLERNQKITVILPAFNASETLLPFLQSLPMDLFDEAILVDDCSSDGTYELAKKQKNLHAYQTPRNLGYGGNIKTCLSLALENGADIIIELHPDNEYKADAILPAISAIKSGAKLVLGNRFTEKKHALKSGLYFWKYPFIRTLNSVCNFVLGTQINDLHQGFRVYTRELLEGIDFQKLSNDYLFSFEIISLAVKRKLVIVSVPVSTSYTGRKRGANIKSSIKYVLGCELVLAKFLLNKATNINKRQKNNFSQTKCFFCQREAFVSFVTHVNKFNLFFCGACNNGFTSPLPNDLSLYYHSSYWHIPGIVGKIRNRAFSLFQIRRNIWLQQFIKKGYVLDIGSGEGLFGERLNNNFKVVNIEPFSSGVLNKKVIKTDFLTWKTRTRFNAITFWESLEHVKTPEKYLKKAAQLLNPGGYIFIEFPQYDSFESKVFKKQWFHLDLPRHITHFTNDGLKQILLKNGLTPVKESQSIAPEYTIAGFFISLCRVFNIQILDSNRTKIYTYAYALVPLFIFSLLLQTIFYIFAGSPIRIIVAKKN